MNSSISNSRRYVIVLFGIFIATMIIFIGVTEAFVRIRVMPGDYVERLKSQLRDPDMHGAAVGDSRLQSGFLGTNGIVNLSFAGNTLNTILGLTQAFADGRDDPILIIQAAPHFFAPYRMTTDQSEFLDDLLDRSVMPLVMMRPHIRRYILAYWSSGLKNPGRLFGEPEIGTASVSPARNWSDVPIVQRNRSTSIRVQLQIPITGFRKTLLATRFETVVATLSTTMKICLVTLPVSADYNDEAKRYETFTQAREFFAKTASRYHVPYLDLWDAGYPDALFGNSDHLNKVGATRLTSEVIDFCRFPEIGTAS